MGNHVKMPKETAQESLPDYTPSKPEYPVYKAKKKGIGERETVMVFTPITALPLQHLS